MVPKGIEALLDPNTLPGTPQQPTQPVATFVEAAPDAPPLPEAPPEMPRIKPRPAPAPASGIPALAQLRAHLTELETQLQQNPMAQLANQVAALTVQLNRIEAALGSMSKLAVALTTRLDEVGLAVGRIEESQERAAKQAFSQRPPSPIPWLTGDRAKPGEEKPVFQWFKRLPGGRWVGDTFKGSVMDEPPTPVEPVVADSHPLVEPPDALAHLTGLVSALDWGFTPVWLVRVPEGALRAFDAVDGAVSFVLSQSFPGKFAVTASWKTWPGDSWAFQIRHFETPEATKVALLRDILDLHGRLFPATVGRPMLPPAGEAAPTPLIDRSDPNVRRWKGEALANVDDVVALLAAMALELPRSATLRVHMSGIHAFCCFRVLPDEIIGTAIRKHFPEVGAIHTASVAAVITKDATQKSTLQDLAVAHHQACKLDWGGPVTWEVSVIGGTVFQCRTLEDALNEVQLRSFVSTLRAVRKTQGEPEETRRIYIASRPLDQVLAEIHKLHADPQWQPWTREGLAANAAEIGGASAYQKVKDRACPLCGAGPGIRCWKLNRKGLATTVNCESPHRERREVPMDHTGGVNDGN